MINSKNLISILLVAVSAQVSFAAKIDQDELILQKPGSSANKKIKMGNGQLIFDVAAGKMKISNDAGASSKNIGSGSGGGAGLNLLGDFNSDFESALSGTWTASGGAASQITSGANVLFGAGSLSFNASAASQTVSSVAVAIPNGLLNQNGVAFCKIRTAATDYKLQVVQVATVIAETVIPAISGQEAVYVPFIFPGSGNIFTRVISQSDAADIFVDDCSLGDSVAKEFSQASQLGKAKWTPASNCQWDSSATSFTNFSADADCNFPTVSGKAQAAGTKIPALVFPYIPAGTLKCEAKGAFNRSGSAFQAMMRFSDGTNFSNTQNWNADPQVTITPNFIGEISYASDQQNVTIQMQPRVADAGTTISILNRSNDAAVDESFELSCYHYPSESSQVQRVNEQPSYAIAKTIDTAALNASTSSTTYVTLADAAFASGTKSYLGSAGVCATANNLCAKAGKLKQAVYDVSLNAVFYANQLTTCSFKVVANGQDIGEFFVNSTAAGSPQYGGVLKGYYVASADESDVEFSLQSKMLAGGTSCGVATDSANSGGHILFEIKPSTMSIADYILKNSKQIVGGTQYNEVVFRFGSGGDCSADPCTIDYQSGGLSAINRTGAGSYRFVFNAGVFASAPVCTGTFGSSSAFLFPSFGGGNTFSSTQFEISTLNDVSVGVDARGFVTCSGQKP